MLVGPLPSRSALAWVAYAREVLAAQEASTQISDNERTTIDDFEGFLTQWEAAARRRKSFSWSVDIDPDQARFFAHAFFNIVAGLAHTAAARGIDAAPPEGDEFYLALVNSLLDALETEGGSLASFAEDLRDRWPGIRPDRLGG